jgi:hypothetical protein
MDLTKLQMQMKSVMAHTLGAFKAWNHYYVARSGNQMQGPGHSAIVTKDKETKSSRLCPALTYVGQI